MKRNKTIVADWSKGWVGFSVMKASEGGQSFQDARAQLTDAGIPCRRGYTPFVGQYGIEVPKKFDQRAQRVLFGR